MAENAVTRMEPQEVAPHRQPATILDVIQNIASNPEIDIERMSALLKLRADEEDRIRRIEREDRDAEDKRAWLRAFAAVQAKIGPIVRGRANDHTQSRYADLADIERIATPILTEHGFSTTCNPVPGAPAGEIRMRLTIGHAEGHEKVYEDDFPLDAAGSQGKTNKTAIQAKGSTQTYARRYLKAAALDLAFMDDNDGNAPKAAEPTISADQFRDLQAAIERAGGEEAEAFLCRHRQIETLHDLRLQDYGLAMTMMVQRAKKLAEGGNA